MIQFKSLVQYTRVVSGIRFPQNINEPFLLVYFSENSTLVEDYSKLNLRKIDARHIILPMTKIPMTRLTSDYRKIFKDYGLLSYSDRMKFPNNKNLLYDITQYTAKVDRLYKPNTYRQRAGMLIQNSIFKSFSSFTENYQKILIYSVDITKPLKSFINRKIFPILKQMKDGELSYDHLILAIVDESGTRYRLIVKDKEFQFARTMAILRKIKPISTEEEKEKEVSQATNKIVSKVANKITGDQKVKAAVSGYLEKQPKTLEKITNDEVDKEEMDRLTVAAILYGAGGEMDRAKRLAKAIPKNKLSNAIKNVSRAFKDDLLDPSKPVDLSASVINQASDVATAVDKKTPERIFQKREIDFKTNLKKDMVNAFKVLENRDIALKFDSISVKDHPPKAGEINKSDKSRITIKLKDKKGNVQEVHIDIPKIDPETGTFRVNGQKKCLINQIIQNPITFPKEFDSKFESSYSSFHIYSKRTKMLKYLEIYMGGFRLPLMILLSFSFGFENTVKSYGLQYKIVKEKPAKGVIFAPVPSSYMVFENLDTELKEEMAKSFVKAKVNSYEIDKEFLSKEYFNDLIIQMTGRVDSTYAITNNLENIVDPIVKQVLANQQLPYDLQLIIKYMAIKVITGFVQDRNDLGNQRIRNSEVLVHLAQKQLLKAYTVYKEQYLAGNEDAKLEIPENIIMTQFNKLEIVQNMEYANPVEEMATITKVSPVGKSVGGIPDKRAINLDARNAHPSYFGNIDPLDTAEGGNIGITQQLTVDAYITSARGLFGVKAMSNNEKSGILSTTTSMIPFIENNEGARIIMAANQAKQMLPLKNPTPPIVQSGYESLLTNVLSDSFIKRAPCTGKVTQITEDLIEVSCPKKGKQKVDITPVQLKSGSGRNTLSIFNPVVTTGQSVKNRDVIAEGACMSGGTIALGRTLSATYMAYKGYNFEDGIVINEKLVENDGLTSLHGIDVEATVEKNDRVLYIINVGTKTEKGDILFRKSAGDIDELLGFAEEDEEGVESYDGQIIIKSPGGTVVDVEVYSNVEKDMFPQLIDLINRTNKRNKKPEKEKYKSKGVSVKGVLIVFKVEQELKIGLGDKLCNRYGNKGIISLIEKDSLMPRTPWGERVDIIHNPLGVLSRMNMGQIYELYCGLISKSMADRIVKTKSKSEIIKLMKAVFSKLDASKNQKFSTKFINNLTKLSAPQFNKMVDQIRLTDSVPIIVPPFQGPSNKNIAEALKIMGLKTGYNLKLPEYNTNTKSKVPFGYQYMSKLEHIGEMKVHARSTGPTATKTKQPLAGKRREGGQRMGEGDTWALAAYNCPTVLSEMFGPLSDDVATKNEIITDIIQTGDAEFRPTKVSPTKELLNSYFVSLMLG
jgi:DNA-directed RNA polymerase beta subunit